MLKNSNLALIDEFGLQFNKVTLKLSNDVHRFETSFDHSINHEQGNLNLPEYANKKKIFGYQGKLYSNSAKNISKVKEKIIFNSESNLKFLGKNKSLNSTTAVMMKLNSSLKNLKTPVKVIFRPSSAKHSSVGIGIGSVIGNKKEILPKLNENCLNLKSTPGFKNGKKRPDIPKFQVSMKKNINNFVKKEENVNLNVIKSNCKTNDNSETILNTTVNRDTVQNSSNIKYDEISHYEKIQNTSAHDSKLFNHINNNNENYLNTNETYKDREEMKKSFEFTFNASIMKEKLKGIKDFKFSNMDLKNQSNLSKKMLAIKNVKNMNFKLRKENIFNHIKKKSSILDSTVNTTSNLIKLPSVGENNYSNNYNIIRDSDSRNSLRPPITACSLEKLNLVPKIAKSNILGRSSEKLDSGVFRDVSNSHDFRIETMSNSSKRNTPKIIKNHPSMKAFFEDG